MRHLISIKDLQRMEALSILDRAEKLRTAHKAPPIPGCVLMAFLQPSTRTRIGFASAVGRCGGIPIDLFALKFDTGMSAEESISDTIRSASGQTRLMVLRHGDRLAHAAAVAASSCPVINAGNNGLEHPTQALIDLFAILRCKGTIDKLRIGLIGDLGSRCAHSLLAALSWFRPAEIRLEHPDGRGVAQSWLNNLGGSKITVSRSLDLTGLDVIYMTGLPAGNGESFLSAEERSAWSLSKRTLDQSQPGSVILCPLPRIDEIHTEIDSDPRARYFQQSDDGLFVRMAILEWIESVNKD